MQLNQVKALVTGGVSGLGLAVVRHIIANGGKAVMLDINDDAGAAAETELGTKYIRTDVTSESGVEASVAQAAEINGGLNVAVNCAGIIGAGRVLGREAPMALDFFRNTIMVNLVGSFNVSKTAANLMQGNEPNADGERGVIISTASVAAYEGQIGQAAYSASKGGVHAMMLPLAREFANFGIRVNTIAPGIMLTPMMSGMPQEVQDSLAQQVPFPKRLGKPEEYADTVQYIYETVYVNSETIRCDGAIRMQAK